MVRKNTKHYLLQLLVLAFLIPFTACKKEQTAQENLSAEKNLTSFSLKKDKNPSLLYDLDGEIVGDSIFIHTLAGTDVSRLISDFSHDGQILTVHGTAQQSGVTAQDFSQHVSYVVQAEDGSTHAYHVKVSDTGLPSIHISTGGLPIDSKEDYVDGHIKITTGLLDETLYEGALEIRGRGNSTWGMPKKPYRIKLESKAALLGMPADKSWALIANYGDQSLLRNAIAFELSRRLKMEYTPRQQYVELFLNDEYMGNYTLTEHIKEGENRIPIDEDNGGFVVEEDGYAFQEEVYFNTPKGMPITVKYPDEDDITTDEFNFIKNYYTDFENRLFEADFDDLSNGYQALFDLESFVNYYLVNEICGNTDMFWSMRMYKKSHADPKIYTGPVWDFDLGFNNDKRIGMEDAVRKLMLNHAHEPRIWINRIMQDPAFKKKVRDRWNEIKETQIDNIIDYADQQAQRLTHSQAFNFKRWDVLGVNVNQSWYQGTTHEAYVNFLREYLTTRINWLDEEINGEQFD